MPGSASDKITRASSGTRPVPTTLTAILGSGSGPLTATCNALTGWPTTSGVGFCIYTLDADGTKTAGSQTDWFGLVSGSTITNCTLVAGTNTGYAIGAVVEASPIAGYADRLFEALTAEHDQLDGTHTAVTADSVATTGAITAGSGFTVSGGTVTLPAGSIENADLAANAAWATHTSVVTGFSATTSTAIRWQQIGKTVHCAINIDGTSNATGLTFTLPVAAKAADFIGGVRIANNGAYAADPGLIQLAAGSTTATAYSTHGGAAWTNVNNKVLLHTFVYEAN